MHSGYSPYLAFGIYDNGWKWADSGITPQTETWYHLAGTWGAEGLRIYVNGELQGTHAYTGGIPANTQYAYLGADTWGDYLEGMIDEFSLYDRALTGDEINALYTTSAPVTPSTEYFVWGLDLSDTLHGAGGIGGLLSKTNPLTDKTVLYTFDANGNVGQLVNSSTGELAAAYEYDPFGNLLRADGPHASSNPFRFSTKYFDKAVGLYYYGYRYYSPELERWTTRDPLEEEGGLNLYGFVRNNPLTFVDRDGRSPVVDENCELYDYDFTSEYHVIQCEIKILFGHFTYTPHRILTEAQFSGATIICCCAGGCENAHGCKKVPAKEITPFPGSQPLSNDPELGPDEVEEIAEADFKAAKTHAQKLYKQANGACCQIKVSFECQYLTADQRQTVGKFCEEPYVYIYPEPDE